MAKKNQKKRELSKKVLKKAIKEARQATLDLLYEITITINGDPESKNERRRKGLRSFQFAYQEFLRIKLRKLGGWDGYNKWKDKKYGKLQEDEEYQKLYKEMKKAGVLGEEYIFCDAGQEQPGYEPCPVCMDAIGMGGYVDILNTRSGKSIAFHYEKAHAIRCVALEALVGVEGRKRTLVKAFLKEKLVSQKLKKGRKKFKRKGEWRKYGADHRKMVDSKTIKDLCGILELKVDKKTLAKVKFYLESKAR